MNENKIAIFEGKQIRKVIFQDEWWFSITVDNLSTVETTGTGREDAGNGLCSICPSFI